MTTIAPPANLSEAAASASVAAPPAAREATRWFSSNGARSNAGPC